ncbi:DUF1700 domain-containing protein [Clostridium oceanicum]|uniref:DUF1700 domain-containing protein n=1 Tax=Clostridium oceanicum TaxID=1543 RepID=A0ABP3UMB7_9CLOT
MNKKEFLNTLYNNLRIEPEAKKEIMYDYEEHFDVGIRNGKSEEEISKELGDPRKIAKQYTASERLEKAKKEPNVSNIFSAVIAALALGFFNLVFVLGFSIAIAGILFTLVMVSGGITVTGGMLLISPIMKHLPYVTVPNLPYLDSFLLGMIFVSGGILAVKGSVFLNKKFYIMMYNYTKKNIEIVTGKN